MSLCSLDNTDWATVLCTELGYPAVQNIKYIRENDIDAGDTVTFSNPDCNLHTTKSMQDCGLRPDLLDCGNFNDVYVKCAGIKPLRLGL